jgi:hypothetical protein
MYVLEKEVAVTTKAQSGKIVQTLETVEKIATIFSTAFKMLKPEQSIDTLKVDGKEEEAGVIIESDKEIPETEVPKDIIAKQERNTRSDFGQKLKDVLDAKNA